MKVTLTTSDPKEVLKAIAAEARRQSDNCNSAAQMKHRKRDQEFEYARSKALADFAAFLDMVEVVS